jgi:hypothetical protein
MAWESRNSSRCLTPHHRRRLLFSAPVRPRAQPWYATTTAVSQAAPRCPCPLPRYRLQAPPPSPPRAPTARGQGPAGASRPSCCCELRGQGSPVHPHPARPDLAVVREGGDGGEGCCVVVSAGPSLDHHFSVFADPPHLHGCHMYEYPLSIIVVRLYAIPFHR